GGADRGLVQLRPRPDVDRADCRLACLSHEPLAGRAGREAQAMKLMLTDIGPVFALLLFGFLPNEIWRIAGLVLVRGLDEKSQVIIWVRAVATAMLAGVLAQLILSTSGALASIPLGVRIGAAVLGFAAFMAMKRSVFTGVLVGEASILLGTYLFGG